MKVSLLYTTARPWLIESVADRWLGEDVEMIVITLNKAQSLRNRPESTTP